MTNLQQLQQEQEQSARQAVESAPELLGISLDYSAESLQQLDEAIAQLPDAAKQDSEPFGAYLGEVFRQAFSG